VIEMMLVLVSRSYGLRQKAHVFETGVAEGGAQSVDSELVVRFILRTAKMYRPAND
jgi:hypothetical protein